MAPFRGLPHTTGSAGGFDSLVSSFADINLDGASEIITKWGDRYGSDCKLVNHTYYHIAADLSLVPILCLEALHSTSRRVPGADRGTNYNIVRYIEPVQSNHIIVHTTLSLDPYTIGEKKAGFVVLESENASSPFEVKDETVLMENYGRFVLNKTFEKCRHCDIHMERLRRDVVPVRYGLIMLSKDEVQAFIRFPHAKREVLGGCLVSSRRTKEVWYCTKCREAEDKWLREKSS